jgi:hypothetical protein
MLYESLRIPTKRKVFISYHHKNDQGWFNEFSRRFSDVHEVFCDKSLDNCIRSDDPEYVSRRIREDYIVGSSVTIVLCGAETWKRKYVDWEIYSTLHHQHALLGLGLPTAGKNERGEIIVPDRLVANVNSGYAHWIHWTNDPSILKQAIETAITRSVQTRFVDNSFQKMARNLA